MLRLMYNQPQETPTIHKFLKEGNRYYECEDVSVWVLDRSTLGFESLCRYFVREQGKTYGNEEHNLENVKFIQKLVVIRMFNRYIAFFDNWYSQKKEIPPTGITQVNLLMFYNELSPDNFASLLNEISPIGNLLHRLGLGPFFQNQSSLRKTRRYGMFGTLKNFNYFDIGEVSQLFNDFKIDGEVNNEISNSDYNESNVGVINFSNPDKNHLLNLKFCDKLVITNTESLSGYISLWVKKNPFYDNVYSKYLTQMEWILIDSKDYNMRMEIRKCLLEMGVDNERIFVIPRIDDYIKTNKQKYYNKTLINSHYGIYGHDMYGDVDRHIETYHTLLRNFQQEMTDTVGIPQQHSQIR